MLVMSVQAVDQDIQMDLLMSKITMALKEKRYADALPAMEKIEGMESTMNKPLSEGFHFLYIDTLDKSGNFTKALKRTNVYMEKFGKRGKHYAQVVDMIVRLQETVEKEEKRVQAEAIAREEQRRIQRQREEEERQRIERQQEEEEKAERRRIQRQREQEEKEEEKQRLREERYERQNQYQESNRFVPIQIPQRQMYIMPGMH